jgi:hypothetical protein
MDAVLYIMIILITPSHSRIIINSPRGVVEGLEDYSFPSRAILHFAQRSHYFNWLSFPNQLLDVRIIYAHEDVVLLFGISIIIHNYPPNLSSEKAPTFSSPIVNLP